MPLSIGDIIEGKYRIKCLLGEGGMGAVYEGENVRIQRRVAIKVLHSAVAADADATLRFEREAQAAGRIGNEHILEVLDLGELPGGDHFMVMEFLDGEPLSARIASLGRLTSEQAVAIFIQILESLRAAHAAGIVHRDLKPDNVFLIREKMGHKDFVKLIDFGISKFQPLAGELKMTRTGTVMGTPYYMSPEQASGSKEADFRSDLYSVGVMLYEALAGSVPFDAPTFNQLLFRIVLSEPAPLRQLVPELDEAFASIVSKAMARDATLRFQSAEAFTRALQDWTTHGLAVSVPPTDPGDVYLPQSTKGAGTPGAFLQRPAAGAPVHASEDEFAGEARPDALIPVALASSSSPPHGSSPVLGQSSMVGSPFRGTGGAWANTQRRASSSSAAVVAGLAGGVVLLAVVAGAGWWFWVGGGSSAAPGAPDAGGLTVNAASAASSTVDPFVPAGAAAKSGAASRGGKGEGTEARDAGLRTAAASAAPSAPGQGSRPAEAAAPAAPVSASMATQRPQAVAPLRPAAAPRAPTKPGAQKPAKVDFGY